MYEFTPKKSNNNDGLALIALVATTLLFMFLSSLDFPYRSLMQLLAIMFLTLSLALLGRYRFRTYSYTLAPDGQGAYDLCVTEITRRSRITVCRISTRSIERALLGTSENKKQLRSDVKYRKRFDYCIDLIPKRKICIFSNEGGEQIYIELSECAGLLELLTPAEDASEL